MKYEVISTGSKGNAVIINGNILIDCGVPFKSLSAHYKDLSLVLLTHIHSDHFYKPSIKRLARERPTLRFGCGDWLVEPLIKQGVNAKQIDILRQSKTYVYNMANIKPVELSHDVPNMGFIMLINGEQIFYATDTGNLNGVSAPMTDYFFIEANYEDEALKERMAEKRANGEYIYEKRKIRSHLSKKQADDFIVVNGAPRCRFIYLHGDVEAE